MTLLLSVRWGCRVCQTRFKAPTTGPESNDVHGAGGITCTVQHIPVLVPCVRRTDVWNFFITTMKRESGALDINQIRLNLTFDLGEDRSLCRYGRLPAVRPAAGSCCQAERLVYPTARVTDLSILRSRPVGAYQKVLLYPGSFSPSAPRWHSPSLVHR